MTSYLKYLEWNRAAGDPGQCSHYTALTISQTCSLIKLTYSKNEITKADNEYYFFS
jgi:hypothetical protein